MAGGESVHDSTTSRGGLTRKRPAHGYTPKSQALEFSQALSLVPAEIATAHPDRESDVIDGIAGWGTGIRRGIEHTL
ncbi:hypothetical protein GCM10007863_40680 [Dyella mobilis]|nr:hypothetical protein GCM10007863_40680 [Dyella mobilis]